VENMEHEVLYAIIKKRASTSAFWQNEQKWQMLVAVW